MYIQLYTHTYRHDVTRSLPLIDFNKIFYNVIVTFVLILTYLKRGPQKAYTKHMFIIDDNGQIFDNEYLI
jgi:hypothetical protein